MHNISCSHYISVLTPLVEWQKGHPVCKKNLLHPFSKILSWGPRSTSR